MRNESFIPLEKFKQGLETDPVLDQLMNELKKIEAEELAAKVAAKEKRESAAVEVARLAAELQKHFGEGHGLIGSTSMNGTLKRLATGLAVSASLLSSIEGETEAKKKNNPDAIEIKHAPREAGTGKDKTAVYHSKHHNGTVATPAVVPFSPNVTDSMHGVTPAQISTFETTVGNPALHLHDIPALTFENTTKADNLIAAPLSPLETSHVSGHEVKNSIWTPVRIPGMPEFVVPVTKDTLSVETPKEIIDSTTMFDFSDIGVSKTKKTKAPVEHRSGKAKVIYSDEKGNAFDPSILKKETPIAAPVHAPRESDFVARQELLRMDSVFHVGKSNPGDTAVLDALVDIPPELAEKHFKDHDAKIERMRLSDGTYMSRIQYASKGIDTVKEMRWLAVDDYKIHIEGNRTIPSILEHRIDKKAWKKLVEYGDIDAQNVYFAQVESKKSEGVWMIEIKSKAVLMVFDENNVLINELPSLLGTTSGEALNTYTLEHNENGKTTPAGNYLLHALDSHEVGTFGHSAENTFSMLRMNPDGTLLNQGIAFHGEISKNKESQEKTIHTDKADDNHETIGCIRVDAEAMKTVVKELHGRKTYKMYVTPDDTTFGIDPVTGEVKKMTDKEKYQIFHDGVIKFWNENPVIYYVSKIELEEAANGQGKYTVESRRDPSAPQKIKPIKVPDTDIKVPAFKK